MPENINELMWWILNGTILVIAFYIRNDLKEIKTDLKDARNMHNNHEIRIVRLEVSCKLRHGTDDDTPARRISDLEEH